MPIIRAAIKHLRQSEKRRSVNRTAKNELKDALKNIMKLAKDKNVAEFAKKLPEVMSIIDKAAKKNLIQKNNAARKKSRLARLLATK